MISIHISVSKGKTYNPIHLGNIQGYGKYKMIKFITIRASELITFII